MTKRAAARAITTSQRRRRFASRWLVAGALALPALAFVACGGGEGEDRPTVEIIGGAGSVSISGVVEGYGEELYEPETDQTLNLGIGLDLKDIRALMAVAVGGDEVDWDAVRAIYEGGKHQTGPGGVRTLAELASDPGEAAFPDAEDVYGSGDFLDKTIREGIDGTGRAAGLEDRARRQIVDKGIQAIQYALAIGALAEAEDEIDRGDGEAAGAAVDAAWAAISGGRDENGSPNNGLLATGIAREDDFTFQGRLSRPLEASLFSAAVAARRGDTATFASEVQASREYLNTIMYLSTLRYAVVLPGDARSSDREGHLAEGWGTFQAIRAQVAAAEPEAATTIQDAYSQAAGERFSSDLADAVFAALNQPAVLAALQVPTEFQVQSR